MSKLALGDNAPEFSVKIKDGSLLKLSELKGKYVVLYFYPKDDTPGCTIEAKDFNSKIEDFVALNAQIIGISKDDIDSHDKFSKKYDLKINLGADTEGKLCEDYGVWIEKSMFGKKYMGINRATFLIDTEGKIAYIWPSVSVVGHAKAVLNKLKELVL